MLPVATFISVIAHAFAVNFVKGVIGMWFRFLMILGVAVVLSTYLSGVISWLTAVILYFLGMFSDFIEKLASGRLQGGGPAEAFYRLTTSRVIAAPLDDSTMSTLLRRHGRGLSLGAAAGHTHLARRAALGFAPLCRQWV